MINLFVSSANIEKMSYLTKSQISILCDYYSNRYNAWEAWGDLYDAMESYSEQKYHIYKAIYKHTGTILENQSSTFDCKMDLKKYNFLYEQIKKSVLIKIIKRKKIITPLNSMYDDKIVIKFIVYRQFILVL